MSRGRSHPFRALFVSEVRQLWRNILPWPFLVAAPALFVAVGRWQAPGVERSIEMIPSLSLLSIALSALAAWTWQRDRRTGADAILLAWPVPSWRANLARTLALGTLTLACWLELALPSLAYTAISYVSAARAAGVAAPLVHMLRDGGLIALSLAASFLGAQVLGQLAGALLPGLAALAVLVLCRAAVLFAPRVLLETLQWPYGLLATPEFLWDGFPRLAEGLQVNLYTGLFVAHQGFWVLGGLGMAVLLILLVRGGRDRPAQRRVLFAAPALLVTVGAALPFIAVEHRFVALQQRAVAEYGEPTKPPLRLNAAPDLPQAAPVVPVPVPLSYRLAVDLRRPPLAQVQAAVGLQAPADASLEALTLTLRRAFQVDAVELDGIAVPAGRWERDGDLLRVRPEAPLAAGQSLTVTLTYHGRVEDWRLDPYEKPQALVSRDLVVLPAGWAWYPVPGEQRLTWEIGMSSIAFRALADQARPFNLAEPDFDVAVQTPVGITALAGFAPEGAGRWRLQTKTNRAGLFGGPWQERVQGDVRLFVPFEELDTWQAGSPELQRVVAAAADWTGIAPLTVVPGALGLSDICGPGVLDELTFGAVFQSGAGRDRLAWGAWSWTNSLLRYQAQSVPGWSGGQGGVDLQEAPALRAYVVTRILDDALGAQAEQLATHANQKTAVSPLVKAWAERTPLAAQKEALHRFFQTAQMRQLTPTDLAFLGEGGQP